ncbi:MAG: UDP-N-acetylmuramoyl-L-alanyl-D-glutamate--2,6-diaminopimelate ligase [Mesorhizobium sp.]|uniref:Mur ligase family protein n=1 Tax=Mesorhizobium sp. TaxID=1871066 RepID=UPI000FE686B2|nr:UDP-N-acetylmuramoyl-L-alanyl-D-glutamate--2,6-diaminopimelate ligase [Mesorhizobium sp.]RWC56595.1 MAG: UDP-N-acetylmuramoyl-L-alanyl-D-glutamate--2,6-diaminopimelate ligase [Mesorhizobium sp.]
MKLAELLNVLSPVYVSEFGDAEQVLLYGAALDSRKVDPGDVFFALEAKALTSEGDIPADVRPQFIAAAIKSGAQVVVSDEGLDLQSLPIDDYARLKTVFVKVKNPELAFAQIAFRFVQKTPQGIAAVTGTNGKTSTVSILRDIWRDVGRDAYSLGTLGLISDEEHNHLAAGLTTPQPDAFCKILREIAERHPQAFLVVEASSQGLNEERLSSVELDVAAFSNLTRDHLDYHRYNREMKTKEGEDEAFDRYFRCKQKLFLERLKKGGAAVINLDDPKAPELMSKISKQRPDIRILTCSGKLSTSDFFVERSKQIEQGIEMSIRHGTSTAAVTLPLFGAFQSDNAVLAVGMAVASGVPFLEAVAALRNVRPVRGRMELVGKTLSGGLVYVDYAHTDDALRSILVGAREAFPGRHISIVFGAGGNRDGGKRPRMGKVASELADRVFITDDNPRKEDPNAIRGEVMNGITAKGAQMTTLSLAPRDRAIERAVAELPPNGILLIAGKGHEDYQEISGRKFPFDDSSVARRFIFKSATG